MSTEYVTLTRDDPDFEGFLLGTFARDRRALPVETYQGQHSMERVTFRLVPVDQVRAPAWWRIYFRSCRPELASLTLGPAVATWLFHSSSALAQWTRWPSWFALAGIFFLHTAGFLYNDYQGHVQGTDRVNRQRGSQVIQKGWVTAAALKRWSWVNGALALLFGIPAFFNAPVELAALCMASAAAIFVISQGGGRRWGVCDLALVLLFGPLLTCGIALASFASFGWDDVVLGVAFGSMTAWIFHVRQFGFLFRSRPEMFRTWIAFHPFDRARFFAVVEGILVLALQMAAAVRLDVSSIYLTLALPAGAVLVATAYRMWRSNSPLASPLEGIHKWAIWSHLVWTTWWILALGSIWL